MKQTYLFIPSFVFNAMRRSLTKAQCGEVITSVADCISSGDDAPCASITKGSDKYAFFSIVLEATKMQSASGRASRGKSTGVLSLPLMNILVMHGNLNNSDLAEVVFKVADFCKGEQVESFDKNGAMQAYYSMLVSSMDVGASTNIVKNAKADRKGKTAPKRKTANMHDVASSAEDDVSAEYAIDTNSAENTESAENDESDQTAAIVDLQANDSSAVVASEVETDTAVSLPTFEQLCTKFGGYDNADFLAKSKDLWEGLTSEEKCNADAFVETYQSSADVQHYLYQYLNRKPWLAE